LPFELTANEYGKDQIRLVRVVRDSERHILRDVTVHVSLIGDFDKVYTDGDNTGVPATDTMKNVVFALAKTNFSTGSIEDFGVELIDHFAKPGSLVHGAKIHLIEHPWVRLDAADGSEHDHAFFRGSSGDHHAWVEGSPGEITVTSGISDLFVMKTTGSGWEDFERDEYTTLPPTDDRILATVLDAKWIYGATAGDFEDTWHAIVKTLLDRFGDHYSPSVQTTIYNIGTAILEAHPSTEEVKITAPNRHHLVVNLEPFDLDNTNEVFVATQDPFGLISGTVTRT
jgi:urate oxidase